MVRGAFSSEEATLIFRDVDFRGMVRTLRYRNKVDGAIVSMTSVITKNELRRSIRLRERLYALFPTTDLFLSPIQLMHLLGKAERRALDGMLPDGGLPKQRTKRWRGEKRDTCRTRRKREKDKLRKQRRNCYESTPRLEEIREPSRITAPAFEGGHRNGWSLFKTSSLDLK